MFLSIQSFSVLIRFKTATNCPACWRLSEKTSPISSTSFSRLVPTRCAYKINRRTSDQRRLSKHQFTHVQQHKKQAEGSEHRRRALQVCIGRSQKKVSDFPSHQAQFDHARTDFHKSRTNNFSAKHVSHCISLTARCTSLRAIIFACTTFLVLLSTLNLLWYNLNETFLCTALQCARSSRCSHFRGLSCWWSSHLRCLSDGT